MSVLLIGGPSDGQRMDVDERMEYIEIVDPPSDSPQALSFGDRSPSSFKTSVSIYKRYEIVDGRTGWSGNVYVHDSTPLVMQRLIDGYNPMTVLRTQDERRRESNEG
jgi:hypothetical protein